ncbi:hypothetical protein M422DRAFT_259727 [Sphaerobolus stellatus SS14]|uniref:SMP-30/Gluconolactonase/LRE-like region domain-containing protein n=1 Tax=Sphaerobolus stellatus (strain SS14) TaxID=990650 RepID=A0A0C9V7T6_SPHS4|nr:hypothetical protein M422DRAFT_259727 [Sphaerobolus stellatus SS14]
MCLSVAIHRSIQLPNQVYRFDPKTGAVRVATDEVDECNGIAFSPDGKIAYIADSGAAGLSFDPTHPATIYAFDVDPQTQQFRNRRVLAYIDTGVPDGLQVDSKGNVYASTADGVQVYDPTGVLLGKIFIGTTSANNIFAGPGRLVILALSQIFLVEFAAAPALIELQEPSTPRISVDDMRSFSSFTFFLLSIIKAQCQRLPPQTMLVDVAGLAVLGNNGSFRSPTAPFNPTNATPPFFQVWDTRFLDILGSNASVRVIADHNVGEFPFAHEAPIWDPNTDQVFFASSTGTPGVDHPANNQFHNGEADLEDYPKCTRL